MSTTRQQILENALQKKYPHHIKRTYPLLAHALLFAEDERNRGNGSLSTTTYANAGIIKPTLDKLEIDNLVEVENPGKFVRCERQRSNLFSREDQAEAFQAELDVLLDHASLDLKVREIVTNNLGLTSSSTLAEISEDFLSRNPPERLTIYTNITKTITTNRLNVPNHIHYALYYKSSRNRYSLSEEAVTLLGGLT